MNRKEIKKEAKEIIKTKKIKILLPYLAIYIITLLLEQIFGYIDNILSINTNPNTVNNMLIIIINVNAFPKCSSAFSLLCWPKLIETLVAVPIPISIPKAIKIGRASCRERV